MQTIFICKLQFQSIYENIFSVSDTAIYYDFAWQGTISPQFDYHAACTAAPHEE